MDIGNVMYSGRQDESVQQSDIKYLLSLDLMVDNGKFKSMIGIEFHVLL